MKFRLFTAGTHNGLTFSNEDVAAIHTATVGAGKLPFVIGHPKNDLPIVGWLPKSAISIYEENGKKSTGFNRSDAEFSAESIEALKATKQDKISVRLLQGAITHIGLVRTAAVAENNFQNFSAEEKSGIVCFGDNINFEAETETPAWFEKFKSLIFSNIKKETPMSEDLKKLQQQLDAANAQIAEFQKKEEDSKANAELAALKQKVADFEKKETEALQAKLKTKVEALKLSAEDAKAKMDFGTNLIKSNVDLAKTWIAELKPAAPAANVKQGSVTDADDAAFAAKPKDVYKAAEEEARKRFESIKKQNA